MADELSFTLLGSPHVQMNGTRVDNFVTSKAEALLYYLAATGRVHTRIALAGLFWPDAPDDVARKNLRDILFNLRKLVGSHLIITRQTLGFDLSEPHWIDSTQLCAVAHSTPTQYDAAQLQAAVDLYHDDFLAGFYVRDAASFEEWVLQEREKMRTAVLHIMHLLVAHYVEIADWNSGLQISRRILTMEPWDEAAHRQQMRLLAGSGQRGAALAQFEQCRRLLATELGIEPAHETSVLYELIRAGTGELQGTIRIAAHSPNEPGSTTVAEASATGYFKDDLETVPQAGLFVGRQLELEILKAGVANKQVISIVGLGGQGKTALVARFATIVAQQVQAWSVARGQNNSEEERQRLIQRILWYGCQNAPTLKEILVFWLQQLSEQSFNLTTATTERLQQTLLSHLRCIKCILILDNFESFLSTESGAGHYRPEHKEIQRFLDQFISASHQSCLIITSREQPLNLLHQDAQRVQVLQLHGMTVDDAISLLKLCRLQGQHEELCELTNRYSGHPLALKIVAEAVHELFTGNLASFLQEETLFFDDIRNLLAQQFARLSPLELEIILWLAIIRDAVTPQQIWDSMVELPPRNQFFEAIRSLQRRALLETEERPKRFTGQISLHLTLPAVVLEYAGNYLINEIGRELHQGDFHLLQRYALVRAQDPDYIRQVQIRFLLQPIAQQLTVKWGEKWGEKWGAHQMEQRLDHLVIRLRQQMDRAGSYAAANLMHLMQYMQISLCEKDFSGLSIRQADLRRVPLTNTNLSNTILAGCAFADYFGAVLAVAFSPDNQLLATATTDGDIHLWRTDDGQLAGVCHGNGRWIWSLAFHPEGQQLISACADKQLYIWDIGDYCVARSEMLSGGVLLRTLQGHTNAIFSVAYSADGKLLASGSADGTIRLWCAIDGTFIRELAGHRAAVFGVAFDPTEPSGSRLASGSRDRVARLWDTTTGESLQKFVGHTDEILSVAFQRNGHHLVTVAWDHTVRVWNLATGEVVTTFTDAQGALLAVACHPDNDTIAATGNDHMIYLWSLSSNKLKLTLRGHFGAVGTLAFAGDGSTLASGSFDQTIRLWDSDRGHALRTYHGHRNEIRPLALSADGAWLANGNVNQTVCLWDVGRKRVPFASDTETPRHIFQSPTGAILSVAFHPTENRLASAGQDGVIRLWEIEPKPTLIGEYQRHGSAVLVLAFSPNGHWLASGDTDRTICLWDLQQGRCTHRIEGLSKLVETLTFTPDSNYLLSGGDDGIIHVYHFGEHFSAQTVSHQQTESIEQVSSRHAPTAAKVVDQHLDNHHEGEIVISKPHRMIKTTTNGIHVLTVSPDGRYLVVGGADPHIEIWQFPHNRQQTEPATFGAAAPSSLERLLLEVNDNPSFRPNHDKHHHGDRNVYHRNDGDPNGGDPNGGDPNGDKHWGDFFQNDFQLVQSFLVTTSTFALALTPDNHYLVSGGGDHKIYVWDLVRNQQVDLLTGHTATVFALRFDPQGQRFYSSSADETIRVWERSGETWTCVTVFHPPGLYRGLNIFGASGINPEKRLALRTLGAIEQPHRPAAITPPNNLPSSLTSLYGREEEIALLTRKLSDPATRLLTIWGEGGVGKTRLALELARAASPSTDPSWGIAMDLQQPRSSFTDGVWFVPLAHTPAEIKPEEHLATTIGGILNITFGQNEPLPQELFARLQTKQLLLLLDSFEHLTAATDFLVQLLQAAPGVQVIVTSRHRLNLVAQTAYRLQGLAVPTADEEAELSEADLLTYPGVRLFVDRMERLTGNFVLTPNNRPYVLTLCRLVNGLPLGIELAATQIHDQELAEVVEMIEADLTLLRSDAYDLPKEQQSLHAVFHQSWYGISAETQQILATCAVFQGGFSLEAAHVVAMADVTQMQMLCDRSLIFEQGNDRYGMHDFIRSFAKQHADQSIEWEQIRARHARYYLQMLHTHGRRSCSTAEKFQILSIDRENIRAAWQWMVHHIQELANHSHTELLQSLQQLQQGLEGFFYLYERFGYYQETEEVSTKAIAVIRRQLHIRQMARSGAPHPIPDSSQVYKQRNNALSGQTTHDIDVVELILQEILAEILIYVAAYRERVGDVETAERALYEAIALAQATQTAHLEANAIYLLAMQQQQAGELAAAHALLTDVEQLTRRHDLIRWQAAMHNLRGILYDMQGNPMQAMAHYTIALPLAIKEGDLYQERLLVNNMGLVALSTGRWEEARQYLQRNLELSQTLGDPTRYVFALMNHALLLDTLGLYPEAERDLHKAQEIARDIRHRQAEIYILQFLALLGFHTGSNMIARQYAEESLVLIERHGLLSMKAQGLTVLGHNLLSLGEKELALENYTKAISLWRAMDNQLEIYTARAGYAFAAVQLGKMEEAVTVVKQIIEVLDHLCEHHSTGITWIITACYYILQITADDSANAVLQKGYRHVQKQADQISDPELRHIFLTHVFANRTIFRLMQNQQ